MEQLFSATLAVFDHLSGHLVVSFLVVSFFLFFSLQSTDSSHTPLAQQLCYDADSPDHLRPDHGMSFIIKALELMVNYKHLALWKFRKTKKKSTQKDLPHHILYPHISVRMSGQLPLLS